MSPPRDLPGIPRGRTRSRPEIDDGERVPERVYEILEGFDDRVGRVEDRMGGLERGQSAVIERLEDIKATDRQALTKLLIGLITTAIVTIGGVVGGMQALKPAEPAPVHGPARSALDVKLDVCRGMAPGPGREECTARVIAETEH